MDSGRFLLAIVLMIALVVVTNILLPPTRPAGEPAAPADDSVAVTPPEPTAEQPERTPPPPVAAEPDSAVAGADTGLEADTVIVDSNLYRYGFSTRGAGIVLAELLDYESLTRQGRPVELTPPDAAALIGYRMRLGSRTIDVARLPFSASVTRDTGAAGPTAGPTIVRLVHEPAPDGTPGIELTYTLDPDRYLIDVNARVAGNGGETPELLIDFAPTLRINEANAKDDETALGYVVNGQNTGIESVNLRDVEGERIEEGPLVWAAVKNKYFVTAAVEADSAPMPFGGLIARPLPAPNSAELTATLLANSERELAFRLYIGPQESDRLTAVGHDLRDVNTFGWRVLQPILRPIGHGITWALVGMHTALGIGYGWVLILFGILIRVVLWPLNAKAMRSQLKNMEMQPRLKEIQAKYKQEPERLQKEMLKLYREEGFNPMGGCLPMLIPFPILIALFFVFQSTIEFRGVPFLWLPDLSRADPLFILPILLGISMFALQWLSMRTNPQGANPQMKFMMYAMPAVMIVIFFNFASGLNLYYASMNVASIPQQLHIINERKRWHARRGSAATAKPAAKPAKS